MKKLLFPIFTLLHFSLLQAQSVNVICTLGNDNKESSGLIFLNQNIISHNDSGGQPALMEIDTSTGQISRTVYIQNAQNVDWEDICMDKNYIYIGDFGNNQGSRTDLKIYRIAIADYLSSDTLTADTINFSYSDQTSFAPSNLATNYDAEALIAFGDSLYIFTKNWLNSWTNVYALSKTPGTYSLHKTDSIDVKGYISGAAISNDSNTIVLTGYNILLHPFVVKTSGISSASFSSASIQKMNIIIPSSFSGQVEGICHFQNDQYFISSENSGSGKNAGLFGLSLGSGMGVEEFSNSRLSFYPNPTNRTLSIDEDVLKVSILSENGQLIINTTEKTTDVSTIATGHYIIILQYSDGTKTSSRLIIQ